MGKEKTLRNQVKKREVSRTQPQSDGGHSKEHPSDGTADSRGQCMKQPNDECSKDFIGCMNGDLVVLYMIARSLKNKFMSVLDLASK